MVYNRTRHCPHGPSTCCHPHLATGAQETFLFLNTRGLYFRQIGPGYKV